MPARGHVDQDLSKVAGSVIYVALMLQHGRPHRRCMLIGSESQQTSRLLALDVRVAEGTRDRGQQGHKVFRVAIENRVLLAGVEVHGTASERWINASRARR